METTDRLAQLVRIHSVSSASNLPMTDTLAKWLEELGFDVQRQRSPQATAKENLIATAGPSGAPALALVGHTDTVPFDADWAGALEPETRDGRIFGRGACDTKAFISAAVSAAAATDLSALSEPLALIFTYDEEVGCIGAKQLLEDELLHPARAIVGEPTSLRPIRANKGYCLARIILHGREGHSAYPDVGVSAIFNAGRLLTEIERIAGELRKKTNDAFDPPYTSINVGLIEGGKAKNVIAGRCELTLEWRPLPEEDPHDVYDRIADAAERLHGADSSFEVEMEELRIGRGFDTPADADVVQFLAEAAGTEPDTVAFGTEGPEMTALGARAVVFGPGDIQVAHRTGEFVPIDELDRCAAILGRAIERFCKSS